jgi:hypothetical protein
VQHRPLRIALASLVAALATSVSALAVTGSTRDGEAHPYVGALVVDGAVACSGVLVARAVFATAAHCGPDGARVAVSFESALDDGWKLRSGTFAVDPGRGSDLAVVLLDAPAHVAPASLPHAGTVETLVKGDLVTSVGYGYSGRTGDGAFVYDGLRRAAASPVLKVAKSLLTVSTNDAGPCLGDSGGPQLQGDTVLSLTSSGSNDCTGKAYGTRLDTASARTFLAGFIPLP